MAHAVTPILMFDGVAEEAMNLYVSLFENAEIRRLDRHGRGEQGAEGSVNDRFGVSWQLNLR